MHKLCSSYFGKICGTDSLSDKTIRHKLYDILQVVYAQVGLGIFLCSVIKLNTIALLCTLCLANTISVENISKPYLHKNICCPI